MPVPETELSQAIAIIRKNKLAHLSLEQIGEYAQLEQRRQQVAFMPGTGAKIEGWGLETRMNGLKRPTWKQREMWRLLGIGYLLLALGSSGYKAKEGFDYASLVPARLGDVVGAQADVTKIDLTKIDPSKLLSGYPEQVFAPAMVAYNRNVDAQNQKLGEQVNKTSKSVTQSLLLLGTGLLYGWFRPWRGASRFSTLILPWIGKTLEIAGRGGKLLQRFILDKLKELT